MTAPRFLGIAGPPDMLRDYAGSIEPPADTTTCLNRVFDSPDLIVFADPETPFTLLPGGRGIIVGRIYDAAAPFPRKAEFSDAECRAIASEGAAALIGQIWGCYVAFLLTDQGIVVLRDPSATAAAHHQAFGAVDLYFSSLALLEDAPTAPMKVDPDFVRHWLTFSHLRGTKTGITGITEIPPGGAHRPLTNAARHPVQIVWTPWSSLQRTGLISDARSAASQLRETAIASIAAIARSADAPVLELSGGLDSSIVAASLAQAGIPFEAANFVTMSPDGDERHYANLVALSTGASLHELFEAETPLILEPPHRALRPRQSSLLQPVRHALERFAVEHGFRTFVTGGGGDSLFCYVKTTAPILDAVRARGWWAARSTVTDVASMSNATTWTALSYAIGKYRRRTARPIWRPNRTFLTDAGIASIPEAHPWLDAPPDALVGKREHVDAIVRHQYFLDQDYPAGTLPLRPLMNQPLMELCLAIPSWLWVDSGMNRAMARRAFADALPSQIIYRRTKGHLETMSYRRFNESREAIAHLLLDGALVARGLVDRPALAAYLAKPAQPADALFYRVLDLVSMELWLRSWGG